MRVLLLLSVITIFHFNLAYAARVINNAAVEIVDPVAFNYISDSSVFDVVKSNRIIGQILSAITKGFEYIQALPETEYVITGSRENAIQIRVTSSDPDATVKISDFVVNYKGGEVSNVIVNQPAPGKASSIKLAGKLKVASNAQPGYHNPSFEVAVYYE